MKAIVFDKNGNAVISARTQELFPSLATELEALETRFQEQRTAELEKIPEFCELANVLAAVIEALPVLKRTLEMYGDKFDSESLSKIIDLLQGSFDPDSAAVAAACTVATWYVEGLAE